jgi:hypothetical protein
MSLSEAAARKLGLRGAAYPVTVNWAHGLATGLGGFARRGGAAAVHEQTPRYSDLP